MRKINLKDDTKVTGRSRWLFYALFVVFPLWIIVSLISSLMDGVAIRDAITQSYSILKDVSPVAFSFALAMFSYYVLSIRAYNFNQKSALFHKERIMEYEHEILSKVTGHIDKDDVDHLYFLLMQYEYNLKRLEDTGFYPGKIGESDFYRENQGFLLDMAERNIKTSLGYFPEEMPRSSRPS